jgi:hypothetical protein
MKSVYRLMEAMVSEDFRLMGVFSLMKIVGFQSLKSMGIVG